MYISLFNVEDTSMETTIIVVITVSADGPALSGNTGTADCDDQAPDST